MAQLDKKTYINIVKFTLQSMLQLSKEYESYDLQADTFYYYENTIKREMVLTIDEFIALCKEVGIKGNVTAL